MKQGVLRTWGHLLTPGFIKDDTPIITLHEGDTPLVRIDKFARYAGFQGKLYAKLEGCNPTGSFKDRGMTGVVSKAIEEGSRAIICASTGNTAASAAAYAARAGIDCFVILPAEGVASGKLAQAAMYGVRIIQIKDTFDKALELVRRIGDDYPSIRIVNSTNPYRLEGQKTVAFEIWKEIGKPPNYHFVPVGNAANIVAHWLGYNAYMRPENLGKFQLPRMMGWQAEGAAPIVRGHIIQNPQTIASAIRIGNPARWQDAVLAVKESGGKIDMVSDKEILEAYTQLARLEGIFCEPASAAGPAGLCKLIRKNRKILKNTQDTSIVLTLTGNGLKDIDTATMCVPGSMVLPPDYEEIKKALHL